MYGLNINYQTPDFATWAAGQQNRIDQRAKERNDAYRNLMQMLGRGYGAYKMGQEYRDWKAEQDELRSLRNLEDEYDALQDQYDVEAADRLISNMYASNPYAIPGDVGADQNDYVLYQLGLR